ncbi:MAG: type IV secretory system conjugative DNA transfer family protein [Paracoccus sp. (in: a-proteobacteria)]|nr:type IV secretory system conjugative DNA transfer family protein [Paracoccus sp. (in: a-proteobacteria)]
MTVQELSAAVGKTTKRVVSKSRTVGRGRLEGVNVSERTEEAPLLPEDEARRLDLDDIILVIDGQHPARAKRIKYYDDKVLAPIFESQTGTFPMPNMAERDLADIKKRLAAQEARFERDAAQEGGAVPPQQPQQGKRRSRTSTNSEALKAVIQKIGGGGADNVVRLKGGQPSEVATEKVAAQTSDQQAAQRSSDSSETKSDRRPARLRPVASEIHALASLLPPTDENGAMIDAIGINLDEAIG